MNMYAHLDTPWISGVVQLVEDLCCGGLPVREDLREVLGAQDVPQGGGGQQLGRAGGVANIAHGGHGVLKNLKYGFT